MNSLLQGKIVKVFNTIGRIAMNTTVGIGGLIDVATYEGVKRENEDFGQTLGFYGVGPGPYLVAARGGAVQRAGRKRLGGGPRRLQFNDEPVVPGIGD